MSENVEPIKPAVTKESIREQIFSTKKFKSINIDLFGAEVEIRQPSLGAILDAKEEPNRKLALMKTLVDYCFIPGTNEKLFEVTDLDGLMAQPFGEDLTRLNDAISELTGVNMEDTEKN